jgi:GNAT superfamily N-acetyltransferase
MLSLPPIHAIDLSAVTAEPLRAEALREGCNFIETLFAEWGSGANRYSAPGEILCGALDQGHLVAVGGLCRDPFLGDPAIARIRRVYVRRAWRHCGLGAALVGCLIEHARPNFTAIRLRTENPSAARLYERFGFAHTAGPGATHLLRLDAGAPFSR